MADGARDASAAAVVENVAELQFGPEFEEIHSTSTFRAFETPLFFVPLRRSLIAFPYIS